MQRQFGSESTAYDVVQGLDLHGKRAIVTGGASGLGRETAWALAKVGAEVVILVRSLDQGKAWVQEMREADSCYAVAAEQVDLSDYESVRACAQRLLDKDKAIDILVNNAGIMACPQERNAQGHELHFATNHLGHFLLTQELLPLLQEGAPARVVSVSSAAHRRSPIVFDDIHFEQREYDKWEAYAQSKTANALFALELNRRYGPDIEAFAVNPGRSITRLMRYLTVAEMQEMGWLDRWGKRLPGFKSAEQGAATSTWAATAPELSGHGGCYLENCDFAGPLQWEAVLGIAPHIQDTEAAERLWQVSEQMVNEPAIV